MPIDTTTRGQANIFVEVTSPERAALDAGEDERAWPALDEDCQVIAERRKARHRELQVRRLRPPNPARLRLP